MTKNRNAKPYDLEDRTLTFAKEVRNFVKRLPRTVANVQDGKQLIRAFVSVGANYIEANEALSKKDFLMRMKICRKEEKESRYWLQSLDTLGKEHQEHNRAVLMNEATELINTFGAIL